MKDAKISNAGLGIRNLAYCCTWNLSYSLSSSANPTNHHASKGCPRDVHSDGSKMGRREGDKTRGPFGPWTVCQCYSLCIDLSCLMASLLQVFLSMAMPTGAGYGFIVICFLYF